jgi:hypothetical protein
MVSKEEILSKVMTIDAKWRQKYGYWQGLSGALPIQI